MARIRDDATRFAPNERASSATIRPYSKIGVRQIRQIGAAKGNAQGQWTNWPSSRSANFADALFQLPEFSD